jgi:hypothetical protein
MSRQQSETTLKAGQGHLGELVSKDLHWRLNRVGGDVVSATAMPRGRCSDLEHTKQTVSEKKNREHAADRLYAR